jgi:hypothetical protein
MWIVILNFETETVNIVSMESKDPTINVEEFLEEEMDYNLTNCQWMVVHEKPEIVELIKK